MVIVKFMLGLWASWIALRIVRGVIGAKLGQRPADHQIKPDGKTLELVACPECGLYTTAPCPNCHP